MLEARAEKFVHKLIVGQKFAFIPMMIAEKWINETRELAAMIQGLIRSIRTRAAN